MRTYPRICSLPQICRMNTLGNATFHKKDSRKYLSDGPCMGLRPLGLFAFDESFTSCDLGFSGEGPGYVVKFARLFVS